MSVEKLGDDTIEIGKNTAETNFEGPKPDRRAEVLVGDSVDNEDKFRVRGFEEIASENVQILSDSLVDAVKNLNRVMVEKALVAEDGLRDYAKKLIEQGKNLSENCLNRFQPSDDNTCDAIVFEKYKLGAEETIGKINEFITANSDTAPADNLTDVSGSVLESGSNTNEALSLELEEKIAQIDEEIVKLRKEAVKAPAETIMEIAKEMEGLEQQKARLLQKIEVGQSDLEERDKTEDGEKVEEAEEVVDGSVQVESENSEVYNEENNIVGKEKKAEDIIVEQKAEEVAVEVEEEKQAVLNEVNNQSVPGEEKETEAKDETSTEQKNDETRYVTGETLMNRGHRRELLKVKAEYAEMENAYNSSLREFYMQNGVKSSLLGFKPSELSAELVAQKAELDNVKERYMRQMDTALEARSRRGLVGDHKYEGFNYRKERHGDSDVDPQLLRAFNTKFVVNPYEKVAKIQQEALARTNEKKFKTLKAIIKPLTETMRQHKWAIRGLSIAGAALLGAATGGLAVGAAAAGTRAVRLGAGLMGGATAGAATMHLVDKAVDFNKNIASNKIAKGFSFDSFRGLEAELAKMKQKEFAIKRVGNAATLGAAFVAGMEVGDMADNLYSHGSLSRPETNSGSNSSLVSENMEPSKGSTPSSARLAEILGVEMEGVRSSSASETVGGQTNSAFDSLTQETGAKSNTDRGIFETSSEAKERLFLEAMQELPANVINSQMTPVQVMEILKANGGAHIDMADGGANINKMLGYDFSNVLKGGKVIMADGVNYSGYKVETIREPVSGLARGIKITPVESQGSGREAGGLNVPTEGKDSIPTQGTNGTNYEAARVLVEQAQKIDTGIATDSKASVEGLEKVNLATATSETLLNPITHTPETAEVVREYTVNKGDTIWGIIKSQYASELQGFSEVEKRQLISNIEHKFRSDPELLNSLNLKSGDLDKIYINEKINIAPLEAELKRQIELDDSGASIKSVLDKTSGTKIMVEDMSDANSYITVVDNSRRADGVIGTKEVVFESSANPWETTNKVAGGVQEIKSAVVEKLVKQESVQGNFDKLIPDDFRDQSTIGLSEQQFADHFVKQGNYFFTPDNYQKIVGKFGNEENFARFTRDLVQSLDKDNYGFFDRGRFQNPMEVLGNVNHEFLDGLRGSEIGVIKQFAENNQIKYEALVAWLDREKVLADSLLHKDGTTFNDLLYRGVLAELEEGKDYGLSARAVEHKHLLNDWRKGQSA